jgi:hypothetical protein
MFFNFIQLKGKFSMKNSVLILSAFLLCAITIKAQQKYQLPKGYSVYKDGSEQVVRVDNDFNNDGINDIAIVCTFNNQEENNYLLILINESYSTTNIWHVIPIQNAIGYDLSYNKSVLKFGGCFGNGRYCETYKFKYYSDLSSMRLIGYDEESFGNAANDGGFTKSVNLVTNQIEISENFYNEKTHKNGVNKVHKKITMPIITIDSFNESTLSYLRELGRQFFKTK